jgi:hypothetical protein
MDPTSMVGQASLSIAYGLDVAPRDDPNIALTDEALEGVFVAQRRGNIFNFVPFCTPNSLRV